MGRFSDGRCLMKGSLPQETKRLVELFKRNYGVYMNPKSKYNETQLRREFLDPFFETMGWDISNKRGIAEQYKEVVHEDSIIIQDSSKAPDYCFRVGTERKFFVEAKKPSVNIKDGPSPAYQVRRYAWSAKLPLSIVTNFNEFAVYDCRIKPKPTDKASVARILYFTFNDIEKYWDDFCKIFSRESVWQGSFDNYADDTSNKKGTGTVDEEFLRQLEDWREILAKNIALKNKKINSSSLNYAVQRTLDRILFFRVSEDRGIEEKRRLSELLDEPDIYKSLCKMFLEADDKYNSGLFNFHKTNNRPTPPDELSLTLTIDNKILKEVISGLYYPISPYEFSVMPVEILGQVYERFLGKEIKLDDGRVKIIEKPLVKKAGGVFYTPSYIVNRIVDDAIGPLLVGKNPKQVEKIKILDPACGSGSFLLGAYDYLLRWHLDFYLLDVNKHRDVIYQNSSKIWCLTPKEKKKILLNNLYGVDIDAQAVETTKLSLCLKVLEGETKETLEKQLTLFREQALPDIGENIKCGNSLVGHDIDLKDLSMDEVYSINPFDWQNEFPDVFRSGKDGFDVIIGNPPYLRVQGLNEFHGNEIRYYSEKYKSAVKRYDMYLLFIERSYDLLGKNGTLGFICPHKFINSDFGSGLREFLTNNRSVYKMISFDYNLIFENATTYTCLIYLTKEKNKHLRFVQLPELKEAFIKKYLSSLQEKDYSLIDYKTLGSEKWTLSSDSSIDLLDKLYSNKKIVKLEECFDGVVQGIVTGNDDTHLLKFVKNRGKGMIELFSEALNKNVVLEIGIVKQCLTGKEIKKYSKEQGKEYCVFPYYLSGKKTVIYEEKELKERFPLGYEYLKQFKSELTKKKIKYKTNPKYWYSLHRQRDIGLFESERLITPEISFYANFRIGKIGTYHNAKGYSLIPSANNTLDIYFWMALLNSNFTWWYMCQTGYVLRGGYSSFSTKYLNGLPVPALGSISRELYNQIILASKKLEDYVSRVELEVEASPVDKKFMERQIQATEKQLNVLVYQSYGFSDDEIAYIEKTMRKLDVAA